MEFLKEVTNEQRNSIGVALLRGVIALGFQEALGGTAVALFRREIEQKRLQEGRYLSNCNSIERCNRVIEYYEDVFGTFEWAH